MPSHPENLAIIAAAGARKTETIIDRALAETVPTLITTYTTENLRQIAERIRLRVGFIPPHVTLRGWFSFLLSDAIRPYQLSVFDEIGLVRGLNFEGTPPQFTPKAKKQRYYLDRHADVYRSGISDLACAVNQASDGAMIERLEALFSRVFVDEVQDMVGHDLDFLDLLFSSAITTTVVGDPRQHTFATNRSPRNKKYRGAGFNEWVKERSDICVREERNASARCSAEICEFASRLFPNLPPITSEHSVETGHDGIHEIEPFEVHEYVERYSPTVLRWNKRAKTLGQPAINIGVAKGSTFDRVLIFPTKPIKQFLVDGDASKLKAPEHLYVAVTRARYSVAFVL